MNDLHRSWARTEAFLQRALELLPANLRESVDGGRLSEYHHFVSHNELALAFDELEGLGNMNPVPREFWRRLAEAAREMELPDDVLQRLSTRISSM